MCVFFVYFLAKARKTLSILRYFHICDNSSYIRIYILHILTNPHIPDALIFADVATAEDARIAASYGADFVAPTLYGYTKAGCFDKLEIKDAPDYILLMDIVDAVKGTDTKVIMEGKVSTPEIAVQCLYMGAHAVVVGNAITRPHITAKRFARALARFHE